jgi:hypothetical protein
MTDKGDSWKLNMNDECPGGKYDRRREINQVGVRMGERETWRCKRVAFLFL